MFVNPFERMKKIREDKERVERETREERDRYARLGVQMGLTKSGGVVPSFMQNIISDDKKGSVPPFGMSDGADSYVSAPMPSTPRPSTTLSNDALKDLSLPGGGGAQMITPDSDGRITPDRPVLDSGDSFGAFAQDTPPSAPSGESHMPGNSFPSTPGFSVPASDTGFASPTSSSISQQPISNLSNDQLSDVKHDESFFNVEQNAIDQIDALLNLTAASVSNNGEVENIVEVIKDSFSSKQMFALFGDLDETNDAAIAIKSAIGSGSVDIEMKKMYSYTTPYLYVIKAIINGISKISVEDKRALWDRVAIYLSATAYGKKGTDIELIFEEELAMTDPMESAKDEFKNAFAAYEIDKEPFVITLRDFRGLSFSDMNDCLLFIADLFTGVKNLKFIFELPYDSYVSHFRLSASKSWMSLFDIVVNTKADQEIIDTEDEDVFQGFGGATQQTQSAPSQSFSPIPEPSPMPSFSAPSTPSSSPMMSEPTSAPMSAPGGFAPPGGQSSMNKSPTNHQAVKPVTKDDDDDVIRIHIDETIKRAEQEQREMEELEQQQRKEQLLETTIDPSVLVDVEEGAQGQGNMSGIDIFSNFNVGYRGILNDDAEPDVNDHPSNIKDERPYEEIKDRLTDLSNSLESNGVIKVDSRLLERGRPDNDEDALESKPQISVSGSWDTINNK